MSKLPFTKTQKKEPSVLWFSDISKKDGHVVGGKNASLGEMYNVLQKKGVAIPNGFAVPAYVYTQMLKKGGADNHIKQLLKHLDTQDIRQLQKVGKKIRQLILGQDLPEKVNSAIVEAYETLKNNSTDPRAFSVAVRSSATAEDLPEASFAGQQETYVRVSGKKALLLAVKKCMASLFTDRAISYREGRGYDHMSVALSVCIQEMVRSDKGASGVLFTMDTESGFRGVTLITASYGLGEYIVKGRVTPDQFYVFKAGAQKGKKAIISKTLGKKQVKLVYGKTKGVRQEKVALAKTKQFSISDDDIMTLTRWADSIEKHYGVPQDIEWAKDGKTGALYIVQARPETVQTQQRGHKIERYVLKKEGEAILKGIAVGSKIGAGPVVHLASPKDAKKFIAGGVLVTKITDPDWEPVMRKASAIITEQGGKTSHAAIVSRELGLPCVVGAVGARSILKNTKKVTVSCAKGDEGVIYKGVVPFEIKTVNIKNIPSTKTKVMMNIGDPDHAFDLSSLPHDGIGLARLEFIFSNFIRIHPLALVHYGSLKDKKAKKHIKELTVGYTRKTEYGIQKLAEGIGRIAASAYPRPVVVRMSDFKTNEYATLIGGKEFEPEEENPMLGWRGASRYYAKEYTQAFGIECKALLRAREEWGLDNIIVMIPFCRTPEEGKKVLQVMSQFGLSKGKNGLQVYVMCEIPSNVVLAEEFAALFDGFSIGTNDLTQLTLGVDRDTSTLAHIGNANDPSVKRLIKDVIAVAKKHKKQIGVCGQAPSDYPKFTEFLIKEGIDSISLNPDTLVQTKRRIHAYEKKLGLHGVSKHRRYAGLLLSTSVCAGSILVGSGCTPFTHMKNTYNEGYIPPQQIRLKAEEKTKKEFIAQYQEKQQEQDRMLLPKCNMSLPSGWVSSYSPSQITVTHNESDDYFALTIEKEAMFVRNTSSTFVSGYEWLLSEEVVPGSTTTTYARAVLHDGRTLMVKSRIVTQPESIEDVLSMLSIAE